MITFLGNKKVHLWTVWICFVYTDSGKPSLQGVGMTTFGPELCQNHYIQNQNQNENTIREYKDWWDQPSAKQILPGLRKQTFFLPYNFKRQRVWQFFMECRGKMFCDNKIIHLYKFCGKIAACWSLPAFAPALPEMGMFVKRWWRAGDNLGKRW